MDDKKFEEIYTKACDCEPTAEESDAIERLIDKEFSDPYEAITIAYLCGKFS